MKKISKFISVILILMLLTACSASNIQNSTSVSEALTTFFETSQTQTTAFETQTQTTAEAFQTTQLQTTMPETTFTTTTKISESKEPTTESQIKSENVCFLTVDCKTIKDNLSSLKKGKEAFVTQDGYILNGVSVEFEEGDTAFDILKKACSENVCTDNCTYCQKSGIQLEYSYTPAYESYYVEGIHQLYEKDCGTMSGWLFSVNGVFPDYASSSYEVKNGDNIVFTYTCDGGEDVGNSF